MRPRYKSQDKYSQTDTQCLLRTFHFLLIFSISEILMLTSTQDFPIVLFSCKALTIIHIGSIFSTSKERDVRIGNSLETTIILQRECILNSNKRFFVIYENFIYPFCSKIDHRKKTSARSKNVLRKLWHSRLFLPSLPLVGKFN